MRRFASLSLIVAVAGVLCSRPGEAAPGRFVAPPGDFRFGAKSTQSLYVYNSGSPGQVQGEYARYSVPDLQLQETTAADGVGSQVAFGLQNEPFLLDEASTGGFGVYEIPPGTGAQPGLEQFSGVPCYASSFATGPNGDFYVVQYCSFTVLEYSAKSVKGGGPKNPIATYSGGNFGKTGQPGPTYAVVDKNGGLYVGDTGGGVTYFPKGKKTAIIAFPTGSGGYVNGMVAAPNGDVFSIHGPDPTNVYFKNATSCIVDPNGSIARNELGEQFSNGTLVAHLYTATTQSKLFGNNGVSIAVDSKQRVYAGVGASDDSLVLDYDPGASCPTDGLTIVGAKTANPQVAVDAKRDLYVTDYFDNTISAYAGASTKLINRISQATGLINIMYASLE